jgi:DNA-binding CsgD family transcriptional regulator/sugar-specific transcriptional regulator TrmB
VTAGGTAPKLTAIGLTTLQEQAYRYLVGAGEARPAHRIGQALGLGPDATDELLADLADSGLVISSGDGHRASPPEVALGTLVSERDEELDRVRLLAAELQGQYREAARNRRAAEFVEVVHGREQVNRYYLHLLQGARSGLDILTKPPYLAGVGDGVLQTLDAEGAGIRRGVRSRSVYDGDALDDDGTLAIARQSIDFGEEARATSGLPFKLAIVDGRTGFMPLDVRSPALGALLVRTSPLLEALIALFEGIWARAVPIRGDRAADEPDVPAARQADVLRLMSAGLKDEAIARALNLSRRTVQKHVTDIMTALGARTRFQAALLASDRGWVG